MRQKSLKPFAIVMSISFINAFSLVFVMSNYLVQILRAYNIPLKPDLAMIVLMCVGFLANIIYMFLISFVAKRLLYLTVLGIVFLATVTISLYGFIVFPVGYSSFPPEISQNITLPEVSLNITRNNTIPNITPVDDNGLGWIPLICFILVIFCTSCGMENVTLQITSEVFPEKTRAIVAALSTTIMVIIGITIAFTYRLFEPIMSLPGLALFSCICSGFGLHWAYKVIPETENCTLEDIALHFADKSKTIFDRKIAKLSKEIETKHATTKF